MGNLMRRFRVIVLGHDWNITADTVTFEPGHVVFWNDDGTIVSAINNEQVNGITEKGEDDDE